MSSHQDLLAELELTMVPSLRPRPASGMTLQAGERPVGAAGGGSCRRSFWCFLKKQEAEVEFETKSLLGFRRLVGVRRCTLFDEPQNVACGRHCLDAKFRRQWPFALPIADYRRPSGG